MRETKTARGPPGGGRKLQLAFYTRDRVTARKEQEAGGREKAQQQLDGDFSLLIYRANFYFAPSLRSSVSVSQFSLPRLLRTTTSRRRDIKTRCPGHLTLPR